MSRICLLTSGHLATNPRLVKEADALSEAGYEVVVICTRFSPWASMHDATFEDRSWTVAARIPFGPTAPIGTRLKQVIRQRAARAVMAAGLQFDALREAEWHPASPDISAAALAVEADLYIAHYPAALPAAAKAAAHHRALYAFDAEDFHLGDLPDRPEHEREKQRLRAIEARYLPGAAYVSAASPGIADAYSEAYGIKRPAVILNAFPLAQAPLEATQRGTAEPGPSLYWFSQTIGPDRGLETAVSAIGGTRAEVHLYLRGRPVPGYLAHLRGLARTSEDASRIHFLDIDAPDQMERLAAAYDLGLVAETVNTQNHSICLSNKLFTYLLAGVPPLISDTPGQVAFARNCGLEDLVFPIGDSAGLRRRLDEVLSDPNRLMQLRAKCFQLGQVHFNWERESGILLERVALALADHPPRDRTCP